jgi:hypothetical protein
MATLIVPPGTVFGWWTVIEEARIRTGPRDVRAMRCRCRCGTEKVLHLGALRHGTTTSCGCLQREALMLEVHPGAVFGHLTVIGAAPNVGNDRAVLCRCECGTEKAISAHRLRSGRAQWCGCRGRETAPALLNPGEVPLYGKHARGRVALVDEADFDLVMQFRWYVREGERPRRPDGPYAFANPYRDGRQRPVSMHKLITGWPSTDHVNHNGLDNRRENLRPATASQNGANRRPVLGHSSQYKGVRWYPPRSNWCARIRVNGKLHHLGYFANEADAGRAYDAAATEFFGEYASLNFPARDGG